MSKEKRPFYDEVKSALRCFLAVYRKEVTPILRERVALGLDYTATVSWKDPDDDIILYGEDEGLYQGNEYYKIYLPKTSFSWSCLIEKVNEGYVAQACPEKMRISYDSEKNLFKLSFYINVKKFFADADHSRKIAKDFAEMLSEHLEGYTDFSYYECDENGKQYAGGDFPEKYYIGITGYMGLWLDLT